MTGARAIRKGTFKRSYDTHAKQMRKLNKRQANQVKRIVNVGRELKYFQSNSGVAFNIDDSTYQPFGTPFDVAQGTTDVTRVGDSLNWCGKIELKFVIKNGKAGTAASNVTHRIIMFQWHPLSQATPFPIASQVLLPGPTGNPDIHSQYSHDYRHDYKILFDKRYVTVNDDTVNTGLGNCITTGGVIARSYRISLKKAKKNVQYAGGGPQGTNRIFMMTFNDDPHANAIKSTMTYTTKIFFRDS